ncbi:ABC transporter permease [Sedimentibacter sp. zth1]|uniref:ABC transporter permease n=1 Tax=Sedimentibacter sp. zth1 TaxID=2816908 RepID=UPI001A91A652|nr:ABC transporter permease [Sedimentibacter sp. zth1]QSX06528.1 ABC transporter permease [Sedimentibacter sp. zth1]
MKSSIVTIIKKEFARFFGDKRLFFTTVIMPGLMIYIMYSLMGGAFSNVFSVDEEYASKVNIVNLPQSVETMLSELSLDKKDITVDDVTVSKEQIVNEKLDLLIVFPENFDEIVPSFDNISNEKALNIDMYYNSASTKSQNIYSIISDILDKYETSLSNKFDINNTDEAHDLATEKASTGMMFSLIMPMLLMIFLFQACMAIAPESIAGEKERGTIAPLLVTPIKRSNLAIGKIIALAVIALLSGISSALGTMLSLPKLMNFGDVSAAVYGINDYILLGTVIISTILFLVAVVSILSANAKTIKEAQTSSAPLMFVITILGVTSMFGNGAKTELFYYFLPFYNSLQCMNSIFTFKVIQMNIIVAVLSNLAYTGIGVFVLAKMFKSEKIMFNK